MAVMTEKQLAHLRANRTLLAEHQQDPDVDVDEWARYAEEDIDFEAYYCVCMDLDLNPLRPHPGDVQLAPQVKRWVQQKLNR